MALESMRVTQPGLSRGVGHVLAVGCCWRPARLVLRQRAVAVVRVVHDDEGVGGVHEGDALGEVVGERE